MLKFGVRFEDGVTAGGDSGYFVGRGRQTKILGQTGAPLDCGSKICTENVRFYVIMV